MTDDEILERFRGLRVLDVRGQRAPHKPLVVLLAIRRLEEQGPRLTPYTDFAAELPGLLARFGPLREFRGATPALVTVADEAHTHADTFADEQLLRSGFTGAARILWKEDGTGERPAILELGPADRDRFPAKLGQAHAIAGRTFGWLYDWEEVRLNADPGSPFFGQYAAVPDGLRSVDGADRRAFNRYEAHLSVAFAQDGQGTEGFADAGACLVPGVLENCPPAKAAVPMLQPVPEGVVVELRAERTLLGETRFVFDAMTPVEFTEMAVPGGWYG